MALVAVSVAFVVTLILYLSADSFTDATTFIWDSDMPPRNQWLSNQGYCGEVSCVMAGLKYGQYLSQYDVRDISTGSQQIYYLVGDNDLQATSRLNMVGIQYPNTCRVDGFNTCAKQHLAWIKTMVRRGYAVTICVYYNQYLFYNDTNSTAGYDDYDHIVTVTSIESQFDDDDYHPTDILVMDDHALWAPDWMPVYYFRYTFEEFMGSREKANAHRGNLYTLPSKTPAGNFAIAHTGVKDDDGVLEKVRVDTNLNYESPEIVDLSDVRPLQMPLVLTVRVSDLVPGVQYKLYRYDDETLVPSRNFNALAANAVEVIDVYGQPQGIGAMPGALPGTSFLTTRNIMSQERVFYRCVRADAP
jgi:hypothetical protein